MARDQPLTDAEIDELREAMRGQRGEIQDYLESEGVDTSKWSTPPGEADSDPERDTADSD